MDRDLIVLEARSWIGTPYRYQASCRGAGADCLGLLRGVWRSLYGREPEHVPAYTPDWSETDGQERLLDAAGRHMAPVDLAASSDGDLLVFRMKAGSVAKHLAIRARSSNGFPTMIHAYTGQGVVETPLSAPWMRRIAASFRFPDRSA